MSKPAFESKEMQAALREGRERGVGSINQWKTKETDMLKQILRKRYSIAAAHVSGIVIDWGCGYGVGTSMLAAVEKVETVYGIDIDRVAIAEAGVKCQHLPKATFGLKNKGSLRKYKCDWICAMEVLEHMPDWYDFLYWAQVNAKQGIVLSVPAWPSVGIGHPDHKNDFTKDSFGPLFAVPLAEGTYWVEAAREILEEKNEAGKVLMEYLVVVYKKG